MRDVLALHWDFATLQAPENIQKWLSSTADLNKRNISDIQVENGSAVNVDVLPGVTWLVAFFTFKTHNPSGKGRGCVRLSKETGQYLAKTLTFFLEDIDDLGVKEGKTRPLGVEHDAKAGRRTWIDKRREKEDSIDPEVVVIGGGQGGLTAAAQLGRLGVETLIIERNERIGGE